MELTKEQMIEKSKEAYDFFKKNDVFYSTYPNLTGDWEEDKDYWFEEYCEQMERMKNR